MLYKKTISQWLNFKKSVIFLPDFPAFSSSFLGLIWFLLNAICNILHYIQSIDYDLHKRLQQCPRYWVVPCDPDHKTTRHYCLDVHQSSRTQMFKGPIQQPLENLNTLRCWNTLWRNEHWWEELSESIYFFHQQGSG